MTNVVVLASADRISQRNLERTVFNEVSLALAASAVSPADEAALRRHHPGDTAAMWGIWPAKHDRQVRKWQTVRQGDLALFSGRGGIVAAATVAHPFRSPGLARELWGQLERDGSYFTYELMFSLTDVRELHIPYAVLNPALGWSPAATVREANVYPLEGIPDLVPHLQARDLHRITVPVQVSEMPIESRDVESYVAHRQPEAGLSLRREAELVHDYARWLELGGARSCRHKITFPEGESLFTDLYDLGRLELVEAKSSSSRTHVRNGLGQLLDYARHVRCRSRALLVPERPMDDLRELLAAHAVSTIWQQDDQFQRHDPPAERAAS